MSKLVSVLGSIIFIWTKFQKTPCSFPFIALLMDPILCINSIYGTPLHSSYWELGADENRGLTSIPYDPFPTQLKDLITGTILYYHITIVSLLPHLITVCLSYSILTLKHQTSIFSLIWTKFQKTPYTSSFPFIALLLDPILCINSIYGTPLYSSYWELGADENRGLTSIPYDPLPTQLKDLITSTILYYHITIVSLLPYLITMCLSHSILTLKGSVQRKLRWV